MEFGKRFEQYQEAPKINAELSREMFELEALDDDIGRSIEAPQHLNDEAAKELKYSQINEQTDLIQNQLNELGESITSTTQQLAAQPLTPEQAAILDTIISLMDQRQQVSDPDQQLLIDQKIEECTTKLAALPLTIDQASLLDKILELMDAREKLTYSLQSLFRQ